MRLVTSPPARYAVAVGVVLTASTMLAGCDMLPDDLADGLSGIGDDIGDDLGDIGDDLSEAGEDLADELSQAGEDIVGDLTDLSGSGEESDSSDLPSSCAEVDGGSLAGDLIPAGATVDERFEEAGGDAAQLSCVWRDQQDDSQWFALVFAVNTEPDDLAALADDEAEEEGQMAWEVDIDTYQDSYHTDEADELGGDLEFVETVDGSSQQVQLSLPGNRHVLAVGALDGITQQDLERIVMAAASQVGG